MERKTDSTAGDAQVKSWFKNVKAPLAGGLAGFLTRAITQPLDCIKVRHQLQIEPIKKSAGAKYTSTFQTLVLMFKEEGIRGLWKGHVPGQVLSVTYGFGQFLAYDQFNRHSRMIPFFDKHSNIRHIVGGGIAGAFSLTIATPFDVVRTRFIAQDQGQGYKTMYSAFSSIIRKEGVQGLFRGVVPAVTAIAPNAAIQFGTYNFIIERYTSLMSKDTPSRDEILLSGMISGFVAKTCVYPLDLVKKRLQIQQFQSKRTTFGENITTSGMFDCLRQTLKKESVLGLYKGWTAGVIRSASMSGLYFFFYEEITTAFNKL